MSNKDATNSPLTPMMKQYYELKEQAGDAILFFRMGDFYEIFGDDAQKVAPLLQLVLTSREKGDNTKIPFCGVPHHSARGYWLKLIKMGMKIAIADQVEDPSEAKGLVRRAITKVLTPGAIDDPEGLNPDSANYLAAMYEDPSSRTWAIAISDISTGELRLASSADFAAAMKLLELTGARQVLVRAHVKMSLQTAVQQSPSLQNIMIDELSEAVLRDQNAQSEQLRATLGTDDLSSQPCGTIPGGQALLAALFGYLQGLQLKLDGFLSVRPLIESGCMTLDETAIRDLELFVTSKRQERRGSLLYEINRCKTSMGARFLQRALAQPIADAHHLADRQRQVYHFYDLGQANLGTLRTMLAPLCDLERLTTRLYNQSIQPSEMGSIRDTLIQATDICRFIEEHGLEKLFPRLNSACHALFAPAQALNQALVDTPQQLGHGHGVFRPGYHPAFDRLCELSQEGSQSLLSYENRLKSETGIQSLKVKAHKSFGLLIEVTKSNLSKVPDSFIRRQTMVNCERFVTPELKELENQLAEADDQMIVIERQLYSDLIAMLTQERRHLQELAQAIALVDFCQSLSFKAFEAVYCKATPSLGGEIQLKACRHPVIEGMIGRHSFRANDISIQTQQNQALITGPNMAGKSTLMRQVALAAIMHQMGGLVAASEARLPIFDRIFTRVGASDDLSKGQSTFMVEMSEAATILRQSTAQSLVILDEVGRGTSTHDGLALAFAILSDLCHRIGAYTLFATHYHELVPMTQSWSRMQYLKTEVQERQQGIHFTHRVVEGWTSSSYGIEVAKLAGIPESVVNHAYQQLEEIENRLGARRSDLQSVEHVQTLTQKMLTPAPQNQDLPEANPNSSLRSGDLEILHRIKSFKVNKRTPLDALQFISDLQDIDSERFQPKLIDGFELQ